MNNLISNQFHKISLVVLCCVLIFGLAACSDDTTPKPLGYFRIALPKKTYKTQQINNAFSAEIPTYAKVLYDSNQAIPEQINLDFPQFKGCVYLTYKKLKHDLNDNLEYSRSLALKHIQKSSGIDQSLIKHSEHQVYGLIYDIRGSEAASSYQFYATDSTRHFLRGALYFSVAPNNDSLSPVIQFVKKDIEHFLKTLQWK